MVPAPHDAASGDVWHVTGALTRPVMTLVRLHGVWYDQNGQSWPDREVVALWLEGEVKPVLVGGVLAADLALGGG